MRERIEALHEWYCRNVMRIRLTPEVERLWMEWLNAGYSGPDLRDVIRYIRRQIGIGKRNEGALKLTNLIQRSEGGFIGFDQDLGLARARSNLNVDKRLEPTPDAPPPPPLRLPDGQVLTMARYAAPSSEQIRDKAQRETLLKKLREAAE